MIGLKAAARNPTPASSPTPGINVEDFNLIAAFVGHFAPNIDDIGAATSMAGNQVQREIVAELSEQCGIGSVTCYSMPPLPYWPRGPLFCQSKFESHIEFIGYLNLPVVKHFVFAVRLFKRLFKAKPKLCLQYNSYVFENLALCLFRLLRPASALAILIQDIHIAPDISLFSKRGLRSLSERVSLSLAKRFDCIVPISNAIITDFHFSKERSFVFQGGVTKFARELMARSASTPTERFAVFAGALEMYNGVDRLVARWITDEIKQPLHIFGRGTLDGHVRAASRRSASIIFHGLQPEEVVIDWQRRARWNFCFRFGVGLNDTYFFPSKLFNILCAPGVAVVNAFHGFPPSLQGHVCLVSGDLLDLSEQLRLSEALMTEDRVTVRRVLVQQNHTWTSCIARILKQAGVVSNE